MSDNNSSSNKKSRKFWNWKQKKARKRNSPDYFNNSTNTAGHYDKPCYNGAIFTPASTSKFKAVFHPQDNSSSSATDSTSSSNAVLHSVASTSASSPQICEPKTLERNLSSVVARGGTHHKQPRTAMNSHGLISGATGGTSGQSRGQRTFRTVGTGWKPTEVLSKYLAIDCEMVGAGSKGHISQLARCSIVSYDGDVVYDEFIRPSEPVTDYRTRWSGIRKSDLIGATPYSHARKEIVKLLMGKVLVGHAIHNDLKVLSYSHPKDLIRDTSRIPLLNTKAGFEENQVISLKRLTKALFNRDIQTGRKGHSSVEDAKATMELYKLVEVEWERKLVSTT